jgi:hypothetical protein
MPLPLEQQSDRSFNYQYRAIRTKHPDVFSFLQTKYALIETDGKPTEFAIINELHARYACKWCKRIHCSERVDHANKQQLYLKAMTKVHAVYGDNKQASQQVKTVISELPQVQTMSDADYLAALKKAMEIVKNSLGV